MPPKLQLDISLLSICRGQRLDQTLSQLLPEHSRSRLTQWIKQHDILCNQQACRPRDKVQGGELITIRAHWDDQVADRPQAIALDIVFEDDDLIVLDKPAGLVVHPAAGNPDHTLLNGLLHHCPTLAQLPRAGIVHRLDKGTSGLMVIAKTLTAHTQLIKLMQTRQIQRHYLTIVCGHLTAGGTIDAPIGRHRKDRLKMAVIATGKPAVTHYRIRRQWQAYTLTEVQLETGRTHQIRVHFAHQHHPILGDPVYAGRLRFPKQLTAELRQVLQQFTRQALHAYKLALPHPSSGEMHTWEAPCPTDMQHLIQTLEHHYGHPPSR
jgi:23S rRNA pseudouridine1911/1915/1917 synthase